MNEIFCGDFQIDRYPNAYNAAAGIMGQPIDNSYGYTQNEFALHMEAVCDLKESHDRKRTQPNRASVLSSYLFAHNLQKNTPTVLIIEQLFPNIATLNKKLLIYKIDVLKSHYLSSAKSDLTVDEEIFSNLIYEKTAATLGVIKKLNTYTNQLKKAIFDLSVEPPTRSHIDIFKILNLNKDLPNTAKTFIKRLQRQVVQFPIKDLPKFSMLENDRETALNIIRSYIFANIQTNSDSSDEMEQDLFATTADRKQIEELLREPNIPTNMQDEPIDFPCILKTYFSDNIDQLVDIDNIRNNEIGLDSLSISKKNQLSSFFNVKAKKERGLKLSAFCKFLQAHNLAGETSKKVIEHILNNYDTKAEGFYKDIMRENYRVLKKTKILHKEKNSIPTEREFLEIIGEVSVRPQHMLNVNSECQEALTKLFLSKIQTNTIVTLIKNSFNTRNTGLTQDKIFQNIRKIRNQLLVKLKASEWLPPLSTTEKMELIVIVRDELISKNYIKLQVQSK